MKLLEMFGNAYEPVSEAEISGAPCWHLGSPSIWKFALRIGDIENPECR
jgi:hypothetical protein